MKIAIISDTHDNLSNFAKFEKYADEIGVGAVIHCGDVAFPETFGEIAKTVSTWTSDVQVKIKIFLALGNMDEGRGGLEAYLKAVDENLKEKIEVNVFEKMGEIELDGVKIAFGHKPDDVRPFAESRLRFVNDKTSADQVGKYNFVFYGHTHKPWMETLKNGCVFANPGNLSDIIYPASFAILDTETKKIELKVLSKV